MKAELLAVIADLRVLHGQSTQGEWGQGQTSHHTTARNPGRANYRVAEFRHAADASFCDAMHKFLPMLLDLLDEAPAPAPPQGMAEGQAPLTDEQRKVLSFLYGVGDLNGCGFGEKPDGERGNFWWRKHLRAAFPECSQDGIAAAQASTATAEKASGND